MRYRLPATHTSITEAKHKDDEIVKLLAKPIAELAPERELQLGLCLFRNNLDWFRKSAGDSRVLRLMWLLGGDESPGNADEITSRVPEGTGGPVSGRLFRQRSVGSLQTDGLSQHEIYQRVRRELAIDNKSKSLVIVGNRSDGKTAILRKLAQANAADFLAFGSSYPVPIYVPLEKLRFATRPADLLAEFCQYAASCLCELSYPYVVTGESFRNRLLEEANVVVYLDSVEVFLRNNRNVVSSEDLRELIGSLTDRTGKQGRIYLVLATRAPDPDVEYTRLAVPGHAVYRIAPDHRGAGAGGVSSSYGAAEIRLEPTGQATSAVTSDPLPASEGPRLIEVDDSDHRERRPGTGLATYS